MTYQLLNRIASTAYKGLKSVGKTVMKPVDNYISKMENIDHEKMVSNIKMINDNFGSVDNYMKVQEDKKKKPY